VDSSSVLGLETGNTTGGELLEHLGALDDVHGDPDLLDVGSTENGDSTSTSDSPVVYQGEKKGSNKRPVVAIRGSRVTCTYWGRCRSFREKTFWVFSLYGQV